MRRPLPLPRRSVAWGVCVGLALVVHTVCGRFLASRDIFASLLGAGDPLPAFAAAVLVGSRLFLYLLAPGWALHIVVRTALERRGGASGADRARSVDRR